MQPGRTLLSCAALVALTFAAAAAPDEELLGKAAGYPIGTRGSWFFDESVRVGSFSNLDKLLPHYTLKKALRRCRFPPPTTRRSSSIGSKIGYIRLRISSRASASPACW